MDTSHHYGLAVGINGYPGITDLNSPVKDAEAFMAWMKHVAKVPPGNARLIVGEDSSLDASYVLNATPRSDHLYHALEPMWRQMHVTRDEDPDAWLRSRLYVFVSGHGFSPERTDVALLMANASVTSWHNVSCAGVISYG